MKYFILFLFFSVGFNSYSQPIEPDDSEQRERKFNFEFNFLALGPGTFRISSIETNLNEDRVVLEHFNTYSSGLNLFEFRPFLKNRIGLHFGFGLYNAGFDHEYVKNNFASSVPSGYSMEFDPPEYDDPGPIFGTFGTASFDIGLVGKFTVRQVSILPTVNYIFGSESGTSFLQTNFTNLNNGDTFYRAYDMYDKIDRAYRMGLEVRVNFDNGLYAGLRSAYTYFETKGVTRITDVYSFENKTVTEMSHSYNANMLTFQAFIGLTTIFDEEE